MELVLIKVKARANHAPEVQKVLTEYGCNIAVRLGIHEITESTCSNDGLIILQVKPDRSAVEKMTAALAAIPELEIKTVSM